MSSLQSVWYEAISVRGTDGTLQGRGFFSQFSQEKSQTGSWRICLTASAVPDSCSICSFYSTCFHQHPLGNSAWQFLMDSFFSGGLLLRSHGYEATVNSFSILSFSIHPLRWLPSRMLLTQCFWRGRSLKKSDCQVTLELDLGNQRFLIPFPIVGIGVLLAFSTPRGCSKDTQLCGIEDICTQLRPLYKLLIFGRGVQGAIGLAATQDKSPIFIFFKSKLPSTNLE